MNKTKVRFPADAFEFDAEPELTEEEEALPEESGAKRAVDERYRRLNNPKLVMGEMNELIKKGGLPKDFDPKEAIKDEAFVKLIVQMPVKYAVLVYEARKRAENAEQEAMMKLSERLRSRKELPQAERAGASGVPAWDYENMPSDLFRKLEEHLKSQARKGIRVKL